MIYFENIKKLNEKYEKVTIITSIEKKYLKILLKYFNIPNEIKCVKKNTMGEIKIVESKNKCFFSKITSLNDIEIKTLDFEKKIEELINYINNKTPKITSINNNKILLLPRNTVDNYKPNDRYINEIEELKREIIEMGGTILNTYELNDYYLQTIIIKSSDIIIVDYGSSFLVNCIYLSNKKIIVLNEHRFYMGQQQYPAKKIICDKICSNNNVIILDNVNFKNIYPHLL
jgi:hypothetical protein